MYCVVVAFILLLFVAIYGVYESGLPRHPKAAFASLVFLIACMALLIGGLVYRLANMPLE